MSHFIKKCEFGKSHGTCRCASKNKTIITVPCDRPDQHNPKPAPVPTPNKPWSEIIEDFVTPKTLRARMHETLGEAFSDFISEAKVEAILDTLEDDVAHWLVDYAKGRIKE